MLLPLDVFCPLFYFSDKLLSVVAYKDSFHKFVLGRSLFAEGFTFVCGVWTDRFKARGRWSARLRISIIWSLSPSLLHAKHDTATHSAACGVTI